MLVFGVISPHSTVIIPAIGGKETEKVKKTIQGLELARDMLAQEEPEKIIIVSPHQDHGFNVPLYYLGQKLDEKIEQERILTEEGETYRYYYDLGRRYGENLKNDPKKVAIIASAELSHVLSEKGPQGFDEAGPELDEAITEAVRNKNVEALLHLNRRLLVNGKECGLRAILFLFGAFDGLEYDLKVWAYEAPFGIGYLTATLEPKSAG